MLGFTLKQPEKFYEVVEHFLHIHSHKCLTLYISSAGLIGRDMHRVAGGGNGVALLGMHLPGRLNLLGSCRLRHNFYPCSHISKLTVTGGNLSCAAVCAHARIA